MVHTSQEERKRPLLVVTTTETANCEWLRVRLLQIFLLQMSSRSEVRVSKMLPSVQAYVDQRVADAGVFDQNSLKLAASF